MPEIVVVAHDIRSSHNIGAIFRTCEGLGVKKLIISGYSPYPAASEDKRLPHVRDRAARTINKTALGAEEYLDWEYSEDVYSTISQLKAKGFLVASLEQSKNSTDLEKFKPTPKIALILGSEVKGIDEKILGLSDVILEIKMKGRKESFNVSAAAAMCLYKLSASNDKI